LNGTELLVVSADDINLMGENIHTINKHRSFLVTRKEIGLEVDAEKTKCIHIYVS
jgi:hypothetical protein